ncbi:MAG: mercury methylation corrinoid protein HgcA [Syntrophorhabdaceae bacterium]
MFPIFNAVNREEITQEKYPQSGRPYWIEGFIDSPIGEIPRIKTRLEFQDRMGSWKARWGINRMHFIVLPGLYAVGRPCETSPVFVSANYKMSFDRLRSELKDLDAWIVVIDTKGINVWCAAGKGTFGTEEIVRRLEAVKLGQVVTHRSIIIPQLGAPGVAAHEVRKRSGFKVIFGPVRARDIKGFLEAGMKATAHMRTVEFTFLDRLVLTPIEIVNNLKPLILTAAAALILHMTGLLHISRFIVYSFAGIFAVGCVVAPALLPWIPGRAFSVKGFLAGLIWAAIALVFKIIFGRYDGFLNTLALFLVLPAISSYLMLNFTGASTYTSLSGVKREMKYAIPVMISCASAGIVLWIAGCFL